MDNFPADMGVPSGVKRVVECSVKNSVSRRCPLVSTLLPNSCLLLLI